MFIDIIFPGINWSTTSVPLVFSSPIEVAALLIAPSNCNLLTLSDTKCFTPLDIFPEVIK